MTASDILGIVAVTIVALILVASASLGAYVAWRERQRQRQATEKLVEALGKSGDGIAAVPQLYEGLIKLAEKQVEEVGKLREAVELLNSCLLNTREGRTLEPYPQNVARAEAEYEAQQLMREGVPEPEARERARETALYGKIGEAFRR